ncbi:NADP-dependent oxidoreductase [Williamsia sp. 1138]|uniref:NADP-dependent oxidoreductase n=1 Tax=Williamsia sp. 1138 TaxID=1903117 RepID=UPI001FEE84C5|nr:NADP-dependent oxidoreductase [Williamsia sp. 1138]
MSSGVITTTRAVYLRERPPDGEPRPEHFDVRDAPLPERTDGQVLVRNLFMSVDPSMRGRLATSELHYTTNFQVDEPLDGSALGIVVEGNREVPVGSYVRHRLGWRDHAVVDTAAAAVIDPRGIELHHWLGVLGQTGFTAYAGLVRAGEIRRGDDVFVSAAAGAVGSTAGQFATLLGAATVIGSAGGPEKAALLTDRLGFDAGLDYRAGPIGAALREAAPDGIDLYFDNVGGDHLVAALSSLRQRGRVALCGMISNGGPDSPPIDHLMNCILKRITIRGFIVRDHEDLRPEFEDRVAGWLAAGELVAESTIYDGLDNAVDAFLSMLGGGNVGKMLVGLA